MNLAHRVKELRQRKGYSQEILAEESGLSLRTIQRIENSETVPRGDTLKRLSLALGTSPDEIVDWVIQEDTNYLTLMSLSAFSFLLFPILGIVIPLVLWIFKKDKIKGVNELGISILNFQITWVLVLFLCYLTYIGAFFGGPFRELMSDWNVSLTTVFLIPVFLYAFNFIVTLINSIRMYKGKTVKYQPAIPILR